MPQYKLYIKICIDLLLKVTNEEHRLILEMYFVKFLLFFKDYQLIIIFFNRVA